MSHQGTPNLQATAITGEAVGEGVRRLLANSEYLPVWFFLVERAKITIETCLAHRKMKKGNKHTEQKENKKRNSSNHIGL